MNYFLKLNAVSVLYALMVFVPVELMVNVYRISRLTGWGIGTVNLLTGITLLVEVTAGTALFYLLTKRLLSARKANFWSAVLWIPYYVLFIYLFATLFPITYVGDAPNPASGLLIIAGLLLHPFYILILTSVGMITEQETKKSAEFN